MSAPLPAEARATEAERAAVLLHLRQAAQHIREDAANASHASEARASLLRRAEAIGRLANEIEAGYHRGRREAKRLRYLRKGGAQ